MFNLFTLGLPHDRQGLPKSLCHQWACGEMRAGVSTEYCDLDRTCFSNHSFPTARFLGPSVYLSVAKT